MYQSVRNAPSGSKDKDYAPSGSEDDDCEPSGACGKIIEAPTVKNATISARKRVYQNVRNAPSGSEDDDCEPSGSEYDDCEPSGACGKIIEAPTVKNATISVRKRVYQSVRNAPSGSKDKDYAPSGSEDDDCEPSGACGKIIKAPTVKNATISARKRVYQNVRNAPSGSEDDDCEPSGSEDDDCEPSRACGKIIEAPTVKNATYSVRKKKTSKKSRGNVTLSKQKAVTPGKKKVYDKTHYCTFCQKPIVHKIARHLLTHRDRKRVKAILKLPKRDLRRGRLLKKLENEGNFKHNVAVLQSGHGKLVIGRRSRLASPNDSTACSYCNKWLSKRNLWRHTKNDCAEFIAYQKNHPLHVDGTKKTRVLAVKRGNSLVSNAVFKPTENQLTDLVDRMRDDEIKSIALGDELVVREAGLRMAGLGNKQDQKQDDIYRVSQSARTLGRILQEARKTKAGITLTQLLIPSHFDFVVQIAKSMSTDKATPALNVGKTIGMLLTKVCESKYCAALRKVNDSQDQVDATNFKKLIEREWNCRVNRTAQRRIDSEKRNKINAIPLTEDLQKFRHFLISNIRDLAEELMKSATPEAWVKLAKFSMSRLILFNKRRRAEVRELKVKDYLTRPNWRDDDCGEMAMALTPMDRQMAQR